MLNSDPICWGGKGGEGGEGGRGGGRGGGEDPPTLNRVQHYIRSCIGIYLYIHISLSQSASLS